MRKAISKAQTPLLLSRIPNCQPEFATVLLVLSTNPFALVIWIQFESVGINIQLPRRLSVYVSMIVSSYSAFIYIFNIKREESARPLFAFIECMTLKVKAEQIISRLWCCGEANCFTQGCVKPTMSIGRMLVASILVAILFYHAHYYFTFCSLFTLSCANCEV